MSFLLLQPAVISRSPRSLFSPQALDQMKRMAAKNSGKSLRTRVSELRPDDKPLECLDIGLPAYRDEC